MKEITKKISLIIGLFIFLGCSPEEDKVKSTNLIINFSHTVSGEDLVVYPFGCLDGGHCIDGHACCIGGLNYTNSTGEPYNVETLKYLISDIQLHAADGTIKLLKEVHFVNVDDASTLIVDLGELDNGEYTKISFTMGLDSSLNIDNRYVNESWDAAMEWPMNLGYHYMKLEGAFNTITNGYLTHTGPTSGMDMSFNSSFDISLNVDENLGDVNSMIMMEINNWYQYPNEISFASYGPAGNNGIMQNMMMQHKLQANGEDVSGGVFTFTTFMQ